MTDDLTRRLAEQILRGVKKLHEEHNPGKPLSPGTPVAPHAAAERIGISPVGRWYAATVEYLEEQGGARAEPSHRQRCGGAALRAGRAWFITRTAPLGTPSSGSATRS